MHDGQGTKQDDNLERTQHYPCGKTYLTKSVLSSQPLPTLTILNAPKGVLQNIDKLRRFL
jgi:hypothetical protein